MNYLIKCKNCKKEFNSIYPKSKVCNRKCYAEYRSKVYKGNKHSRWIDGRSNEKKICPVCKKEFSAERKRRCCSSKCMGKYYTLNKLKSGKNNGMWKGGRSATKNGYVKIMVPTHPNANKGYVAEHRLVMEKQIGRYLYENEIVHHKNEIKNDNRIENLQLMTKQEHDRLHCIENKERRIFVRKEYISPIDLTCQYCGKKEKRHFFRSKMTCKSCQVLQQAERGKKWDLKQKLNKVV